MKARFLSILLGLIAAATSPLSAADAPPIQTSEPKPDPKPYPLGTCIVSNEKLGGAMGEPVVFVHEGREMKLCCKSCRKDFDAAPAKFVVKVDEAAKRVKPYPLKTCLVSGEELGSMGKPSVFIQDLQEIKLCCKSCKKDFDQAPVAHLTKLKQAVENANEGKEPTPQP